MLHRDFSTDTSSSSTHGHGDSRSQIDGVLVIGGYFLAASARSIL